VGGPYLIGFQCYEKPFTFCRLRLWVITLLFAAADVTFITVPKGCMTGVIVLETMTIRQIPTAGYMAAKLSSRVSVNVLTAPERYESFHFEPSWIV